MAPAYTVAAHFHVRVDAIDVMKQVIDEVTRPSLSEEGCQIYHWSQGDEDPTLFLLYMGGATKPPSTHMLPRRTYRGPNNDWKKGNCSLSLPANGTSIGFEAAGVSLSAWYSGSTDNHS